MYLTEVGEDRGLWGEVIQGSATFKCSEEEIRALRNNRVNDPTISEYRLIGDKISPKIPKTPKPTNNDTKVIFNNPATILFINGKKYVSKAYQEQFDEEKAVAITLCKAFGVSYADIKRMIKGAKRQYSLADKKIKEGIKQFNDIGKEVVNNALQGVVDTLDKLKKGLEYKEIKVGDKVVIKIVPHNNYAYGYDPEMEELKGNVYQIAEVRNDNTFIVYHNGWDYWFTRDEIELVKE